jgi:hypothetical protein
MHCLEGHPVKALLLVTLVASACFVSQAPSAGQPASVQNVSQGDDQPKARNQAFLERAKQVVAEYEIYLEPDRKQKLTLKLEPVLHWTNPTVGEVYGSVFIWTARGRPEAVASIFKWYSKEGLPEQHEFHSLSLSKLYAERAGRAVWYPSKAGIDLTPIADSAVPAESGPARLQQMKSLAREFRAFFEKEGDRSELRLLTQPIYRYESIDPDLLDGAIFAFVRATDPEVLLLIEARRKNAGFEWQYGVARQNANVLPIHHKDQEVFRFPNFWPRVLEDREYPYTLFSFTDMSR